MTPLDHRILVVLALHHACGSAPSQRKIAAGVRNLALTAHRLPDADATLGQVRTALKRLDARGYLRTITRTDGTPTRYELLGELNTLPASLAASAVRGVSVVGEPNNGGWS